jgi:hypothetical protein
MRHNAPVNMSLVFVLYFVFGFWTAKLRDTKGYWFTQKGKVVIVSGKNINIWFKGI